MSDQNPPGPLDENGTNRDASVQMGRVAEADRSMMDPANQSLAEALQITFRIIQAAMLILVALYLISGLQSVQANERAVRLRMGKVTASDLPPGFQPAWPFPFGELVKVDVGNNDMDLIDPFWPGYDADDDPNNLETLSRRANLRPESDGSILTGDGAIAHTQWTVQYRRADPAIFVETIYPDHELRIVEMAVQRGAVQAVAAVTIDDLLKQSSSEQGSVASRASAVARQTLSSLGGEGAGIQIDQMSLSQKIPPIYLRERFISVLDAESRASAARETAEREAATMLAQTAGGAATLLIELIDDYERHTDLGETEQAATTLALIDGVLNGDSVDIDGEATRVSLGGEVAGEISRARQYRDGAEDKARAQLTNFRAKKAVFDSNPSVMVSTNLLGALDGFFGDPLLEVFYQPAGTDLMEVIVNADPEFRNKLERELRLRQNQRAAEQRDEQMRQSRFRTNEGLQEIGG